MDQDVFIPEDRTGAALHGGPGCRSWWTSDGTGWQQAGGRQLGAWSAGSCQQRGGWVLPEKQGLRVCGSG
ncbi:MAG: hypothetical protein ACLTBV_32495 [Enterocloster bolteae]